MEIKFKASSNNDKKLKEVVCINWLDNKVILRDDRGRIIIENMDDVNIVQNLGLKDSLNNEIYEGAVIMIKDKTKWLVEPIGSEDGDSNNFGLCVSRNGDGKNYFIDKSITSGVVVGNIYENENVLE